MHGRLILLLLMSLLCGCQASSSRSASIRDLGEAALRTRDALQSIYEQTHEISRRTSIARSLLSTNPSDASVEPVRAAARPIAFDVVAAISRYYLGADDGFWGDVSARELALFSRVLVLKHLLSQDRSEERAFTPTLRAVLEASSERLAEEEGKPGAVSAEAVLLLNSLSEDLIPQIAADPITMGAAALLEAEANWYDELQLRVGKGATSISDQGALRDQLVRLQRALLTKANAAQVTSDVQAIISGFPRALDALLTILRDGEDEGSLSELRIRSRSLACAVELLEHSVANLQRALDAAPR